jgi:hypothetical protein
MESVEDFLFQGVVWRDSDLSLHTPIFQVSVVAWVVFGCLVTFDPLHNLGGVLPLRSSYLLFQFPPLVLGVFGGG